MFYLEKFHEWNALGHGDGYERNHFRLRLLRIELEEIVVETLDK